MASAMALVATAGLAFVSVTLWTVRVALTAAGRRGAGAVIAGLEAVTFTFAFARIVGNLDQVAGVAAYALGVAAGTLTGVLLDERLSSGHSWVHIIVKGDGVALSSALMRRRWPVTMSVGTGPEGRVSDLAVAVDDRRLPQLARDLAALAPDAFWTAERVRSAHPGRLPDGLRQMRARTFRAQHVAPGAGSPLSSAHASQGRGRRPRVDHRWSRRDRLASRQGVLLPARRDQA